MQKNTGINLKRTIRFICNNDTISTELHPSVSTLDFIRSRLYLTGTKAGCREGDCGACSIILGDLINNKVHYKTVNSCLIPLGALEGKHIVTIEGLNQETLNPIQESFVNEAGIQCGFCTPGFIVSLTGSLLSGKKLNYAGLLSSLDGNICRCTGYASIKRSIKNFIDNYSKNSPTFEFNIEELVCNKIIPEYFLTISNRLKEIINRNNSGQIYENGITAAGSTDLFLQKNKELLTEGIHFLKPKANSPTIYTENNVCHIKAYATVTEISESEILNNIFPEIKSYFSLFGSNQIRNRATLGGNIINSSPIADLTIFFLTLNPILHFKEENNTRKVPLQEFYKGYKQFDKTPSEILELVSFPIPAIDSKVNFVKVSRRTYLDIASVNSAILIRINNNIITEASITAGGVAPFPLLLKSTSLYLKGKHVCIDIIKMATEIASSEISPISDVRGSAKYKSLLLKQLLLSHFYKLFPEYIKEEDLVW